ncbi:MAG: hypothetical protein ABFD92_00345 [Planctomycetaceae bacterium]|nr:hypothetical protein [Planctomycetaceae bacterium]
MQRTVSGGACPARFEHRKTCRAIWTANNNVLDLLPICVIRLRQGYGGQVRDVRLRCATADKFVGVILSAVV